jgi:DnaJ-class molecular chaperone
MGIERMPQGGERKGELETCPRCGGSGRSGTEKCGRCKGTGKLPSAR